MSRLNMKRILTDQEKDCRYRLSMPCMLSLLTDRWRDCTSPRGKQCTSQRSRPRSSTTRSDIPRWAQLAPSPHSTCPQNILCIQLLQHLHLKKYLMDMYQMEKTALQ